MKISKDAVAVGVVLLGALVAAIVAFGRPRPVFASPEAPFPLPEPAPPGRVDTTARFLAPGFPCPAGFLPSVLGYDANLVGPVSLQFDRNLKFIDPASGCVIPNRAGLSTSYPLVPLEDLFLREAFAIVNPHLARSF